VAEAEEQAPSVLSPGLSTQNRRPRRVFIAYSYNIHPKADYRRVFQDLGRAFNVEFVFADEKITNKHILQKIEKYIRESRFGIYDISGWNPNVALELGLARGVGKKWYIAFDPTKTAFNEVPADLRGIDRMQYGSYAELKERVERLLLQEFPRTTPEPKQLTEKQLQVLALCAEFPQTTHVRLAKVAAERWGISRASYYRYLAGQACAHRPSPIGGSARKSAPLLGYSSR
jgi:hypothetical protein